MRTKPNKAEAFALQHAVKAGAGIKDPTLALLAACRAFRDAMPPRKEIASDLLPDYEAGGLAARKVIEAGNRGILKHPIDEILTMAGRALVEKAIPSPKARKVRGLPDYEAIGRAADKIYNRLLSRRKRPLEESEINMQIGRAGMRAAWTADGRSRVITH